MSHQRRAMRPSASFFRNRDRDAEKIGSTASRNFFNRIGLKADIAGSSSALFVVTEPINKFGVRLSRAHAGCPLVVLLIDTRVSVIKQRTT